MEYMQWTDRIRQVKIFLVVAAIIIAVASLVVSHFLTDDLARQERSRMQVWAEAMKSLSEADENTDLSLVLKVLDENNSIPVVVLDSEGTVTDCRNVSVRAHNAADRTAKLADMALRMKSAGRVIRIPLSSRRGDYIDVCYDESLMLKRIAVYPYIQLGVVMLFVVVAVMALLTSKRAEQNKVWVGLSKETAHQLGTPISSLMAWTTILRENYPDDELLPEMDKDVKRLQLIADRGVRVLRQRQTFSGPIQSLVNDALSTPAIRELARADDVCDECVRGIHGFTIMLVIPRIQGISRSEG